MQIIIKYSQLQDLLFFSKNKSEIGLEPLFHQMSILLSNIKIMIFGIN